MKAFICEKYGPPETLRIAEVEKPAPNADEGSGEVLGISVNRRTGVPCVPSPSFSRATRFAATEAQNSRRRHCRASGGARQRRYPVQARRRGLRQPLGYGYGGFAEYVSVPVGVMSSKPANLSFEEAAAVPMAAVTALQGLRHHGGQAGQTMLINGASSNIGTFAVQIAKSYHSEVTGVKHPEPRPRQLARRRSSSTTPRQTYSVAAALRPDPRHDREPIGTRSQARTCRAQQGSRRRVHLPWRS